jgi:hypothetical protein
MQNDGLAVFGAALHEQQHVAQQPALAFEQLEEIARFEVAVALAQVVEGLAATAHASIRSSSFAALDMMMPANSIAFSRSVTIASPVLLCQPRVVAGDTLKVEVRLVRGSRLVFSETFQRRPFKSTRITMLKDHSDGMSGPNRGQTCNG